MKPIIFNPNEPLSHFGYARKQKEAINIILNINLYGGVVLAVLSCMHVYRDSLLLALSCLFNVLLVGSNIAARFKKLDMFVFGGLASLFLCMCNLSAGLSYQVFLYLGFTVFQFFVHMAIVNDRTLSKLIGYPHFSEHLIDASFVTKLMHNAVDTESEPEDNGEVIVPLKNTNGIYNIEKSSEMDSISLESKINPAPPVQIEKAKLKKHKSHKAVVQSPAQDNDNITQNEDVQSIDDMALSLAPPPVPVAPPSFNPEEYRAAVEAEMENKPSYAYDQKTEITEHDDYDLLDKKHSDEHIHDVDLLF